MSSAIPEDIACHLSPFCCARRSLLENAKTDMESKLEGSNLHFMYMNWHLLQRNARGQQGVIPFDRAGISLLPNSSLYGGRIM